MTTALEIGGAFLLAATLLATAMFLVAFQLGRLITRDDEQREVEAAGAPKAAVYDLVIGRACSAGRESRHRARGGDRRRRSASSS